MTAYKFGSQLKLPYSTSNETREKRRRQLEAVFQRRKQNYAEFFRKQRLHGSSD